MRTFYRVASRCRPSRRDDSTASERRGGAPPPPYVPPERHRSWLAGYSAFDSAEAAAELARKMRGKLGSVVVRYDVPEGADVSWEPVAGDEDRGHVDLFGEPEELHRYLNDDFCLEVDVARR